MTKQATIIETPAPAPAPVLTLTNEDAAALAYAARACSILAGPAPAPVAPGIAALRAVTANLQAAGGAVAPQVAAILAGNGVHTAIPSTNRPGLILTGPKRYAATEEAYRLARATGAATWQPGHFITVDRSCGHTKQPGTGGYYASELATMVPQCAVYNALLKQVEKGRGPREITYNQQRGLFIVTAVPVEPTRRPDFAAMTDEQLAAITNKGDARAFASLCREVARHLETEAAVAANAAANAAADAAANAKDAA